MIHIPTVSLCTIIKDADQSGKMDLMPIIQYRH